MFRLTLVAIALILLGVLTTVAVSWWCAMKVDPSSSVQPTNEAFAQAFGDANAAYDQWMVTHERRPGCQKVVSWWTDHGSNADRVGPGVGDPAALLPRWATGFTPNEHDDIAGRHARIGHAWGWPMVALWYVEAGDSPTIPRVTGVKYAIRISPVVRERPTYTVLAPRYLPLRPIWIGLIVDSLVYALMWLPGYGLLVLLLRWRGRLRLKRGRCPNCNYDLRGGPHSACPECGTSLIKRA